jgi:hypothetical protein
MLPSVERHVRNIEQKILPILRRDYDALISGRMRVGESNELGRWADTTAAYAERLKEYIVEQEDALVMLRET